MTTSDGAPEVWRVECEGGEVRSVEAWRQAWGSGLWRAFMPGPTTGDGAAFATPRAAVVALAARQGWPVVAVLAPGEATRAELAAQLAATEAEARRALDALHARCDAAEAAVAAAVAAAVEAEREACAVVADEVARWHEESAATAEGDNAARQRIAADASSRAETARTIRGAIRARGEVR